MSNSSSLSLSLPTIITSEMVMALALFTIPLVISGPQLLVGSVVNMFLFVSASTLSKKQLLAVALLPSLGAVLHGVLFGPFTVFLLYLLPFICLGNLTLMFVSRELLRRQMPAAVRILSAAFLKMLVLSFFAQILFHAHVIPAAFLLAMGVMQFITASIGGVLALAVEKKYERS